MAITMSDLTQGIIPATIATGVARIEATATSASLSEISLAPGTILGNPTGVAATPQGITLGTGLGLVGDALGFGFVFPPQGRLSLAPATPVMTSSVPSVATIYYTPYNGVYCPVWSVAANAFVMANVFASGDLSQSLLDTTLSPAAAVANSVYDMFVWVDGAGGFHCTRGPVWTNTSTRSMALQMVNGILTNGLAITNGPAANQGTYVGTIATDASANCNFVYGAADTGGVGGIFMVWNYYNRVDITSLSIDNGAAFNAPTTVKEIRNGTGMQTTFVSGSLEEYLWSLAFINSTLPVSASLNYGVGLDTASAITFGKFFGNLTGSAYTLSDSSAFKIMSGIGLHTVSFNMSSSTTSTTLTGPQLQTSMRM